jgi:hypothetical protein
MIDATWGPSRDPLFQDSERILTPKHRSMIRLPSRGVKLEIWRTRARTVPLTTSSARCLSPPSQRRSLPTGRLVQRNTVSELNLFDATFGFYFEVGTCGGLGLRDGSRRVE